MAYASGNMAMEESNGNMQSYSWADVEVAEVRRTNSAVHTNVLLAKPTTCTTQQ